MNKSILFLIPNVISDDTDGQFVNEIVKQYLRELKVLFCESPKTARKFLKICDIPAPYDDIQFLQTDEHEEEIELILKDKKLQAIGLISDSGAPAVADPGSKIVLKAYQYGWDVKPLIGASSILLALMASGMNGQGFTFHGYLPVNNYDRISKIKELERTIDINGYTQIFIETPYRNQPLFDLLLRAAQQDTLLHISLGLTSKEEFVHTNFISEWKKLKIELPKTPCIFILWRKRRKPRKTNPPTRRQ